jgi:hypothetical protein
VDHSDSEGSSRGAVSSDDDDDLLAAAVAAMEVLSMPASRIVECDCCAQLLPLWVESHYFCEAIAMKHQAPARWHQHADQVLTDTSALLL